MSSRKPSSRAQRAAVTKPEASKGFTELPPKDEKSWWESDKRCRLLLNTMAEGVAIADTEIHLVYVNDRLCRMLGYRRGELLGQTPAVFLDRANLDFARRQFALRKKGIVHSYEIMFTHKSGRAVFGLVSPARLVDTAGRFTGSISIITDITKLKRTEDALRKAQSGLESRVRERTAKLQDANEELKKEITRRKQIEDALVKSEQKYHQLFATETNAIILADFKRRVLEVNESACRLYGYSSDEFLELDLLDISADPAASMASVAETFRKKRAFIPLRYHKKKDGTQFPAEISATTCELEGQRFIYITIRDITGRIERQKAIRAASSKLISARDEERRRLSRELHDSVGQKLVAARLKLKAAAEEIAGQLAAARRVAHFSQDVSSAPATSVPARGPLPNLRPIERVVANLSSQIGELADEVRNVSRALYPPTLEALGLCAALHQLASDLGSAGPRITVRCGPNVSLHCSLEISIALYRIAQEALSNAIRHGKPRRVEANLCVSDGQLVLSITDDGKGFPQPKSMGGLGLISMKERAEAIGATFRVDSKPGRTTVLVQMPTQTPS